MTTIVEKYHCINYFFSKQHLFLTSIIFFLTNNYYFSCHLFPVTSLTSESNRLTRENQHLMSEASRHTQDFTNRPTPMPNMSGLYDMYGRESTNEADRLRKLYVSLFYHYVLFAPELKTASTILIHNIVFFGQQYYFFLDKHLFFLWQLFFSWQQWTWLKHFPFFSY